MKFHGCAHLRDFLVRSQFSIYAHDLWNESIIGISTCRDFREREREGQSQEHAMIFTCTRRREKREEESHVSAISNIARFGLKKDCEGNYEKFLQAPSGY